MLPYPDVFIGRDDDTNKLLKAISFSRKPLQHKIICILGLPGVGKSSLALHIGNLMQDDAIVYHVDLYVGLSELPQQQNVQKILAEKILGTKNVTYSNLLDWAHNQSQDSLIILDNCDAYIHNQEIDFKKAISDICKYSDKIIILTTSQKEILHSNYHWYKLEPLTEPSAFEYLENRLPSSLNETEKKDIAKLTGRIPFALKLIGSLLSSAQAPPTPAKVIANMKKTPSDMHSAVNTSCSYLDNHLQEIGRYLAYFPGSFGESDAIAVLSNITQHDKIYYFSNALNELALRSLLVYIKHSERYYFHKLIKEFFLSHSNSSEKQRFDNAFQVYFGNVLCERASEFTEQPEQALYMLDTDRHNILYFMTTFQYPSTSFPTHYGAIDCFESALKEKFLHCRFSQEELEKPIESIVALLENKLLNGSCLDFVKYGQYIHHLALAIEVLKGAAEAAWLYRNKQDIANKFSECNTDYANFIRHFQKYESKLTYCEYEPESELADSDLCCKPHYKDSKSEHYFSESGAGNTAKYYISKLEYICSVNECNPYQMGMINYEKEEWELSAEYFERAISDKMYESTITEVSILLHLQKDYMQTENGSRIDELGVKLNNKFPFMMKQSISNVYSNIKTYDDYEYFLYNEIPLCTEDYTAYPDHVTSFDRYIQLNELIFESVSKLGKEHEFDVKQSSLVADGLYLLGDFVAASKVASYSLNHSSESTQYFSICSSVIFGKSVYALGNYKEARKMFARAVDALLAHNMTQQWAIDKFNWLLTESCAYLFYLGDLVYMKMCAYMMLSWRSPGSEIGKSFTMK